MAFFKCNTIAKTLLAGVLCLALSSPGAGETTLSLKGDVVRVDVDLSNGTWVSECVDYTKPETCTALSYRATYRMPTTGDRNIPFELRMALEEGSKTQYTVVLQNGFLAEESNGIEIPDGFRIKGENGPPRIVLWKRQSECSIRGGGGPMKNGGIYCDFSKPLVGAAETLIKGMQAGDGTMTFNADRLFRIELFDPAGRSSELNFRIPLEGLQNLYSRTDDKKE
jgi:hypothetical protein